MSFGLTFTNNSDVVTLDSEFSRLVVLQSGNYNGGGLAFSPVITTQEPPLVFLRPNSNVVIQYATISGSPGNWTGWSYIGGGDGKYFAAAFKSREVASFGLRIWNESSNIIFDNGTACAQFTQIVGTHGYSGSEATGQVGQYRSFFNSSAPFPNGDYIMINNMGMDIPGGTSRFGKLACTINLAGSISFAVTGVDNVISGPLYVPAVYAKQIS